MAASLESLKKEIEELGTIESQPDSFYEELMDLGIETGDQFEDSYQGQYQSGAEFAESLCEDCGYLEESNLPMFVQAHIDWESVWKNELRFDYSAVDGHYFTNNA